MSLKLFVNVFKMATYYLILGLSRNSFNQFLIVGYLVCIQFFIVITYFNIYFIYKLLAVSLIFSIEYCLITGV